MKRELTEYIEQNWTSIVYSGVVDSALHQWLMESLEGDFSLWGMIGYAKMELYFELTSDAMFFKLSHQ